MNEEEIEKFSEPPKIIKIKDIRVSIMERPFPGGTLCVFLFIYPYANGDGGMLRVYNSSFMPQLRGEVSHDNNLFLWQHYYKSRNKALKDNPALKILYEGPILGEDGRRKGKYYES